YEPMSELAVSEFDSMIKYNSTVERTSFFKNHKEYTITRKEDNVSKNVSTKDILEVEQAKGLNEISDLYISTVYFKGEEIFFLCYSYNVATVYKYDFDTEDIAFYSWCHVVDSESLCLYFLH
ncbi:MAG: hypothetical protein IJX99_05300, partial [Clostridia bacterium]|nr:hypothetical protein [Clostridia bacterium]